MRGFNRLGLIRGLVLRLSPAVGARRLNGGGPVSGRVGRSLAVAVGADAGKIEDHVHDVCFAGSCVWASAHGPGNDLKLRPVFALKFGPRQLSGLYAHVSPLKCHS